LLLGLLLSASLISASHTADQTATHGTDFRTLAGIARDSADRQSGYPASNRTASNTALLGAPRRWRRRSSGLLHRVKPALFPGPIIALAFVLLLLLL
jgi:hypothetical protein